jgi:hypothetical protein
VGPEHPVTVNTLGVLGVLYDDQGRYQEAESFYRQAMTICEQVMEPTNSVEGNFLGAYAFHLLRRRRIMKVLPYGVRVLNILGLREAFRRSLGVLKPYVRRYILKR